MSEDGRRHDRASLIFDAGTKFRHFRELDGLRGIAVLMVVAGHTLVFRLGRSYRWTEFAFLGVLIFFVLSGFLITGLLCSEERRFGTISLRNFYLRRAFRILPALFVFIGLISLLIELNLVTDTPWTTVAFSMVFLKNIFGTGSTLGHLWSLSLEEQFYFIWPIMFTIVGRRNLLAPTLGIALAVILYRTVAILVTPYDYGRGIFELRTDFRMDSILVGCALALVIDRRTNSAIGFSRIARWATHPLWTGPLLVFWTLYCGIPRLWAAYLTVQTALVCCLVFHTIAFPDSAMGRGLRLRSLAFVGLISYSLYLWQQLFLVVSVPSWGVIRELPLCLFLTAAAALLSYYLVERPFLRLKRRLLSAR